MPLPQFIRTIIGRDKDALWPKPDYRKDDVPRFIFMLTPPFSGSTAMAKILQSAPQIGELTPKAEGQWLIKGMCAADRWEPSKQIDFDSVKSVWLNRYQALKSINGQLDTIIEKSPPNMVRIQQLEGLFPKHYTFINNRNPYACCSSRFHRSFDANTIGTMHETQRQDVFRSIAKAWVDQSTMLMQLSIDCGYSIITYEAFCEDRSTLVDLVSKNTSIPMHRFDVKQKIRVKDYPEDVVTNMNSRQVSFLTDRDICSITSVLEQHKTVLHYFGYEINSQ